MAKKLQKRKYSRFLLKKYKQTNLSPKRESESRVMRSISSRDASSPFTKPTDGKVAASSSSQSAVKEVASATNINTQTKRHIK